MYISLKNRINAAGETIQKSENYVVKNIELMNEILSIAYASRDDDYYVKKAG